MDEYARQRDVDRRFDEVSRRLEDVEELTDKMMTTKAWEQGDRHLRELMKKSDEQSTERHKQVMKAIESIQAGITRRSEWTWQRILGVLTVVVAIAGVWVTALDLTKGIK